MRAIVTTPSFVVCRPSLAFVVHIISGFHW